MNAHDLVKNIELIISNTPRNSSLDNAFGEFGYSFSGNAKDFTEEMERVLKDIHLSMKFDVGGIDLVRITDNPIDTLPKLPFDKVYLESNVGGKLIGCLLQEENGLIKGDIFRKSEIYLPMCISVYYEQSDHGVNRLVDSNTAVTVHDDLNEEEELSWSLEVDGFLRCLQVINCSNVIHSPHPVPSKVNKKRIREKKTPFFSYHTLRIAVEESASSDSATGGSIGVGKSPRVHLRRGHVRKLPSGKEVWVQPCVVGDSSLGIAHKDYKAH